MSCFSLSRAVADIVCICMFLSRCEGPYVLKINVKKCFYQIYVDGDGNIISRNVFDTYIKDVFLESWLLQSARVLLVCMFEVWPAPGAWTSFPKCGGGARTSTVLGAFPGTRGRPDLKHAPQQKHGQTIFRYPAKAPQQQPRAAHSRRDRRCGHPPTLDT